ncbi:MAG: InlB B-repeat-containing protein [Oscillospiraceae bacterium]
MKKILAGISAAVMAFSLVTGSFSGSITGLFDRAVKVTAADVTEDFESQSAGAASFTSNGVNFSLTDGLTVKYWSVVGYNSSDYLLDTMGYNAGTYNIIPSTPVHVKSFYLFPAESMDATVNQVNNIHVTVIGYYGAIEKYRYELADDDFTDTLLYDNLIDNGYSLVDLYGNGYTALVDKISIVLTAPTCYFSIDNFSFTTDRFVTYNLGYDGNDADTAMDIYTTDQIANGGSVTFPSTPIRDNYSFDGWYDATTGGNKITSIPSLTEDTTLYAHWTLNTYTVTFNSTGGSAVDPVQTNADGTITLPTPPTKTGNTFMGWYTMLNGGTKIFSTSTFDHDATVYALWEPEEYTVTLDANGGAFSESDYTDEGDETVSDDTYYGDVLPSTWFTDITNEIHPVKENALFSGWYTQATGGTFVTDIPSVTGNVYLYAHWAPVKFNISPASFTYTGSACTPGITRLKVGSEEYGEYDAEFPDDPYYTVAYDDNIDVGTATITATLHNGAYNLQTVSRTFTITASTIPMSVTATGYTGVYDGAEHGISVTAPAGSTIRYSDDGGATYTLSTSPTRQNAGETTVDYRVTNPSYATVTGSARIVVTVKSISGATLKLAATSYDYDGTAKTPAATVTLGGTVLPAANYDIAYTNNTNVGTATVTVTGKGNYTGTLTATFAVKAIVLSASNVALASTTVAGDNATAQTPAVNLTGTAAGLTAADYTVSYYNNVKAGTNTATAVIVGKGNASGTVIIPFSITYTAPDVTVNDLTITGIDAPVTGASPDLTLDESDQYTLSDCQWYSVVPGVSVAEFDFDGTFARGTYYGVTYTITAKSGYTLPAVQGNMNIFTTAGAVSTTYAYSNYKLTVQALFPATAPVTMVGVQARQNANGSYSLRYVSAIDTDALSADSIETGFFASTTITNPDRNDGTALKATSAYKSIQNLPFEEDVTPDMIWNADYFVTYVPGTFTAAQLTGTLYVRAYYTIDEKTTYTEVMEVNLSDLRDAADDGFPGRN